MSKYKVVGDARILGSDGKYVDPGGTVDLDLPEANIAALITGGAIAPASKPAKPAPSES